MVVFLKLPKVINYFAKKPILGSSSSPIGEPIASTSSSEFGTTVGGDDQINKSAITHIGSLVT